MIDAALRPGTGHPGSTDPGSIDPGNIDPGRNVATRVAVEFPIMGTTGHLVVVGAGAPSPRRLVAQLVDLEHRWSRFEPDSELSRLSSGEGRPSIVSHSTAMLVERAVWAWSHTGGRFDPTVLAAVSAAGYDRSFDQIRDVTVTQIPPVPAPGCAGVDVDMDIDLVRLPAGVAIDPGGIGKGLAADLVANAAVELGADAAMVSIGGDLRVAGDAPAEGWEIELDHHIVEPARLNLRSGAVATSSTMRRRWRTATGTAHHVIDPRTGRPSTGSAVACTVVAGEAWWAESLATAILVGWGDPDLGELLSQLLVDAGALVTTVDGEQFAVGPHAHSFSVGHQRADQKVP